MFKTFDVVMVVKGEDLAGRRRPRSTAASRARILVHAIIARLGLFVRKHACYHPVVGARNGFRPEQFNGNQEVCVADARRAPT
jgi:hypothetical protein